MIVNLNELTQKIVVGTNDGKVCAVNTFRKNFENIHKKQQS